MHEKPLCGLIHNHHPALTSTLILLGTDTISSAVTRRLALR